jgi:hypothetical protein
VGNLFYILATFFDRKGQVSICQKMGWATLLGHFGQFLHKKFGHPEIDLAWLSEETLLGFHLVPRFV